MTNNPFQKLPIFSLSTSPRQQSPIFMDLIGNQSSSIFANNHNHNNNNHNSFSNNNTQSSLSRPIIQSPTLINISDSNTSKVSPLATRPANLPKIRKQTKNITNNNNNNNNNNDNNDNNPLSLSNNTKKDYYKNHICSPFDYPLSNPLFINNKPNNNKSHKFYTKYKTNNNNSNYVHSAPIFCNKNHKKQSIEPKKDPSGSGAGSQSKIKQEYKFQFKAIKNNNDTFSLNTSLLNIPPVLTKNKKTILSNYPPNVHMHSHGHIDGDDDDNTFEYNDDNDIWSNNDDLYDDQLNNNGTYNFLWWYPEINFCEVDPTIKS